MKIYIRNGYYDISDIENPVKYFYDSRQNMRATQNLQRSSQILVKKISYEIHDSYVNYGPPRTGNFYQIGNVINDFDDKRDSTVGAFILGLDYEHEHFHSQIYTVNDMFGQLGGAFEIFEL